jgi:hypothetical protein
MSQESTTPDLVELMRRSFEAADPMSFYAPDAVWDMSPLGLGAYENPAAILGFFEDWMGAYEEYEMALEEALDLGNGVAFALVSRRVVLLAVAVRFDSATQLWACGRTD